ncbi:MAG TPA: sigma-70 family RNA polymerase sigma factor [Candidatus Desulfaltia sp.]|nr:sigma-70 family RNA polymerase sigma factor [Candidatus Desulfaltia sp.]
MREPRNCTDEELAAQTAAGSRAAFEVLVSRYSPRLFNFLRSRSESDEDIEDLMQETFLRAFRHIDRYDPTWRFSTWLYTTAVRLAISRHRANKTRLLPLDPELPEHPSPGPQERLIQKEEAQARKNIWNLARTLKPGEYQALWLRYAEGLPVKDIARAMNKTQIGVRTLLYRSRLKLGQKLRSPSPSAALAEAASAGRRLQIL